MDLSSMPKAVQQRWRSHARPWRGLHPAFDAATPIAGVGDDVTQV